MRTHLTQRIIRQLANNVIHIDPQCSLVPLSRQCVHLQHNARQGVRFGPWHSQTRTLFGFMRKNKRIPKPTNYEPGVETLMQLEEALKIDVRPPPPKEVAEAFKAYVKYREKVNRIEDTQIDLLRTAFSFLTKEEKQLGSDFGLSLENVRAALVILSFRPPKSFRSEVCVELSALLFDHVRSEYGVVMAEQPDAYYEEKMKDALHFHIKTLAYHGHALTALQLLQVYRDTLLKSNGHTAWRHSIRGLILEERDTELERLIEESQEDSELLNTDLHSDIIFHFARFRDCADLTKKWYYHPAFRDGPPNSKAVVAVLGQCIKEDELEWGDDIVKALTQESLDKKELLDMTLRWAAVKGRGVDEIEQMMEVITRRNQDRPELQPDMNTINLLVRLAIQKMNDPYTAERYISLGQKLGFQPDATTYLLQLDYRVKVNDLSGAWAAYTSLRAQDLSKADNNPAINRLIVAYCEHRPSHYDTIMSIVDDLADRKAPFLPEAVAALAKLHLSRGEMDNLQDLLNTHSLSFRAADRKELQQVLLNHIKDHRISNPQAWDTYRLMRSIFHETPKETFVDMIETFFTRGRSDMASYVFGQMRHSQVKDQRPTPDTYALLLEGIGKFGDIVSLEQVHNMLKLDNEVEPNTRLYNGLMLAYIGCGDSGRALGFWEDITESREGPSYSSIQIALRACEWAPFGEREARKIWQRIVGSEMEVTREIYAAFLGALAGQSLFDECVKMCRDAEKNGFEVDPLLLGTFYNAARGVERKKKIKQWMWETYPAAYEELMKRGMYYIAKGNPETGEENEETMEGITPTEREHFFHIGDLGRDAKP